MVARITLALSLILALGCMMGDSETPPPTADIQAVIAAALATQAAKTQPTPAPPSEPTQPKPTPTKETVAELSLPTPSQQPPVTSADRTPLPTAPAPQPTSRAESNTPVLTVASLPWFADGVDEGELEAVEVLYWAAKWHPGIAGVEWIQDGLNRYEVQVVRSLNIITQGGQGPDWERNAERAAAQATQVLGMPFLEAVSAMDAEGTHSLAMLSLSDQELFQRVLDHPRLKPDGLTDQDAVWVWMLDMAYIADANHEGSGRFEDVWKGNLMIVDRQITLPFSGTVGLTSVGIGDEGILAPVKMAVLEKTVRSVEAVMERPYPTDWIVLAVIEGGGSHFGDFLAIGPHASDQTYIHEVAHYYWNDSIGHPAWLAEGGAEAMVELARGRDPVGGSRRCAYEGKPMDVQPHSGVE